MNFFTRLFVVFKYGPEIDELIKEARKLKEKKEFESNKDRLKLCYKHRQEQNMSHHAEHNCDHCKLLEKLACIKGQSHANHLNPNDPSIQNLGRGVSGECKMTDKKEIPDWVQEGDNTLHGAIDHWHAKATSLFAENEALKIERDQLAARVEQFKSLFNDYSTQSGVCCCGDSMDGHGIDNHVPVDQWEYAVSQVLAETPAQSMAHIKAAGAREMLVRAMAAPNFSSTVARIDLMQKIIERMEKGK